MGDQPIAKPVLTQDSKTQEDENINGIRIHDTSFQAAKTHALDSVATDSGTNLIISNITLLILRT